jgi:hypothetical protein
MHCNVISISCRYLTANCLYYTNVVIIIMINLRMQFALVHLLLRIRSMYQHTL